MGEWLSNQVLVAWHNTDPHNRMSLQHHSVATVTTFTVPGQAALAEPRPLVCGLRLSPANIALLGQLGTYVGIQPPFMAVVSNRRLWLVSCWLV